MVRLAPDHDAIKHPQVISHHVQVSQAAIDDDLKLREIAFELMYHVVTQRRNIAVFLGREAFENGDPSMHDKGFTACLMSLANKVA